jgi:hypothetical protein
MSATSATQRPRPLILGLLGATLVVAVIWAVWPAASQPPAPSNQREQRRGEAQGTAGRGMATRPGDLDVRLDALIQPPAVPDDAGRNPFRFYVPPPPPPPPPPRIPKPGDKDFVSPQPPPPPAPGTPGHPDYVPPPPPIPLKFIGVLEVGGRKTAIFSDGRGLPLYGKEGDLILGQYKIVRIGVESIVMEYPDGKGRQTIPMRGQ